MVPALLAVGVLILLTGLVFHFKSGGESLEEPSKIYAPKVAVIYYVISVAAWITGGFVLMSSCRAIEIDNTQSALGRILLSIGIAFGASKMWSAAKTSYETEKKNTADLVDIKNNHIAFKERVIKEKHIVRQAEERIVLEDVQHKTAVKTELTRQEALDLASDNITLERGLVEVAKQQGLRPDQVAAINESKYRSEIETKRRWIEYKQDQDDATLTQIEDHLYDEELTQRLFKAYDQRKLLEASNDPAKEDKLRRLNKNISAVEGVLDGRLEGYLQEPNRGRPQKTLSSSDSPGEHEGPDGPVEVELPPERPRRGRRKNVSE